MSRCACPNRLNKAGTAGRARQRRAPHPRRLEDDPAPFISVQDLTDYLGRDVTSDPGALMAADATCDIIRDITEQDFNQATDTVSLDGTDTDALVLPQRPVIAAGTVTVNGGTVSDYIPPTSDGFLYAGRRPPCRATGTRSGRRDVRT